MCPIGQEKPHSFRSLAQLRLHALCEAVAFEPAAAQAVFDALIDSWGDLPIGAAPRWRSDITDDHTPYELSLSFANGRAEPRFLVESQCESPADLPTLDKAWEAGQATNQRLRGRYGACLERFERIVDLFAPSAVQTRFAMWHAAWLRPGAPPLFKLYLNPEAHGPAAAPQRVAAALQRLGFTHAWRFIAEQLQRRPSRDHIIYFSLDLEATPEARVKIYLAHPGARAQDVEPLLAAAPDYQPGDAERFCRALTGGSGPYELRPLLTCFAFSSEHDCRPRNVTLHLPIRCYVRDDHVALERIATLLGEREGALYRRAVEAVAPRPLDAGAGLQTYVSFRRQNEQPKITVYLAVEAYATAPARILSSQVPAEA